MRLQKLLFFVLFFMPALIFSQTTLSYSINSPVLPNDSAPIATYVPYIDTTSLFMSSGFMQGDTVPDFTLYDTIGNPTTLSVALNSGKPALLVSASLSCPASRHSIEYVLPNLYLQFGSQVNIFIIYILEAHPVTPDFSPYAHGVWNPQINYIDSILLRQETMYGQRKREAANFTDRFNIPVPFLVDGPGNEYWSTFGPAANNAYLISTDGTVYQKYGWFDLSQMQITDDLTTMLLGIGQHETFRKATVFPNPSNGNSTLLVENENGFNFQITDMQGRMVADEENISGATDLSKFHLDAGVYSIAVQGASGNNYLLRYIVE